MDTRRLMTTMLIVGAVMLLWPYIFPSNKPAAAPATVAPAFPIYAEAAAASQPAAAESLVLGSAQRDSKDKLAITLNPLGASVDKVQLNINNYAETVKREEPLTLLVAQPKAVRPFTTLAIRVTVGADTFVYDQPLSWNFTRISPYKAEFHNTLVKGGKPLAEIIKTYTVDPASYDVRISHTAKNLSDGPIQVQIDQLGPTDLPRDDPQVDDRVFHAVGLNAAGKYVDPNKAFHMTHAELPKLVSGTRVIGPADDFTKNNVLWASTANRFFGVIVRPVPADPAAASPFTLSSGKVIPIVQHIASMDVDLVNPASIAAGFDPVGAVRLNGAKLDLAPGASAESPILAFMGPKKREILDGDITAPVGSELYNKAVYVYSSAIQLATGCYANCTWDWLAALILGALGVLVHYVTFGNYGIAIIVLVIVVRALLHPLTRASQINMAVMGKKMKDVAPLIETAKKKYADNKQKLNEETMRIYKENNVNPAGGILGCLPMLIQMPIWAALYSGLRSDIDLRHASFIPGWINDLSHPDTVYPTSLPVIGHPLFHLPLLGDIYGLNLLPILLAFVFFFQMKVTTASQPKPADEQQAQMQNMSKYMIFLFPLFLYSAPSGLNLYIFASTLGGLVDTWLVRKTLKARGILPANAENLPTHEQKNPLM